MMLPLQLDLEGFLERFKSFLARPKDFALASTNPHIWEHLRELETLHINPPPAVIFLQEALKSFKKGGVLQLETLFAFTQMTRYLLVFKKNTDSKIQPYLFDYIQNIHIPAPLLDLEKQMADTPAFKTGFYSDLDALLESLERLKRAQQQVFSQILSQSALEPYLVDRQVHFIQGLETLLLKPGFSHALKGVVVQRSHSGQFYIQPLEAKNLGHKIQEKQLEIELCIGRICTHWTQNLHPHFLFLRFLDRQFDYLDHLQARVLFAKAENLSFIKPNLEGTLILKDFAHPNLKNPKPISLHFGKKLLLITGVNTGGKTMLLKSILSAVFLAKHFLPFKINPHHSHVPYIENIHAIINDPQNSKNDISTFAGRMLDFGQVLDKSDLLLGVDEIELGTDAAEASCLYKVLLEHLVQNNAKVVITTHHKHLAMLLAKNPAVQLLAANYDLEKQMPTYTFTPGLIGKSYAFESALRYGIPLNLVQMAKHLYGQDQENLSALIERTSALEQELNLERMHLQERSQALENLEQEGLEKLKKLEEQQQKKQNILEKSYYKALRELQEALKNFQQSHNKSQAHQSIQAIQLDLKKDLDKTPKEPNKPTSIELGTLVVYKKASSKEKGRIIAKSGDLFVVALDNGLKIKAKGTDLQITTNQTSKQPQVKLETKPKAQANMHLDVCGLDVQEALEEVQGFLSNALLAGFNEVVIIHGKGKGILRQAIRLWLKNHPKVLDFCDAPLKLGGSGAQIVRI
ncbi:endonuclease MutS2 [Helicobacter suis]|uniref:endonuclease MutS2 n=1 Tax=Helicobacter suis TaxID=104628 RepID=UPI00403906A3